MSSEKQVSSKNGRLRTLSPLLIVVIYMMASWICFQSLDSALNMMVGVETNLLISKGLLIFGGEVLLLYLLSVHMTMKFRHEIEEREYAEGELRKLAQAVEQSPASVVITKGPPRTTGSLSLWPAMTSIPAPFSPAVKASRSPSPSRTRSPLEAASP